MRQTQRPPSPQAQPGRAESAGPSPGTTTADTGSTRAGTADAAKNWDVVRTSCGRLLRIGELALQGADHPVGRVTLDIGCQPHDHGEVWMSLTPGETRELARHLLARAAEAELDRAGQGAGAQRGPATAAGGVLPAGQAEVAFVDGDTYAVHVRGHHLLTDQPLEHGGTDVAATPTELFVASLASCAAFYAGRYLARHGLPRNGLRITAGFDTATGPARVAAVRLRIFAPPGMPAERARGLLAMAARCTIHNTLREAPDVDIQLA